MQSFPPHNWEVHHLSEMEHRQPEFPESWKLGMAAYLAVRPSDGVEGTFYLAFGGNSLLNVRFKANEAIPHKSMEGYTIVGQFTAANIMQMNSTASKWVDLKELVQAGDMNVLDAQGKDVKDEFLAATKANKVAKAHLAATIRWMVTVADGANVLELQLQSLPCSTSALKPVLRQDNVATVALAKFPLLTPLFDGRQCAGPVPILFSEDPDFTLDWMNGHAADAHAACQALAARYLAVENLSAKEAVAYISNPREGMGYKPLTRELAREPTPKRQRTEGYYTEEYANNSAGEAG